MLSRAAGSVGSIVVKTRPAVAWVGFTILGLLVLVAGTLVFAIGKGTDLASNLSKRTGSIHYYTSPGQGLFLVLQRSGRDAWGFCEWPERRLYGFFSGTLTEYGDIHAEISFNGSSRSRMVISMPRVAGKPVLRLEGLAESSGTYRLERSSMPGLGIGSFQGMVDAVAGSVSPLGKILQPLSIEDGNQNPDVSFFHIDAIEGISFPIARFLDTQLRAGKESFTYARDRWESFKKNRSQASADTIRPSVFVERQYLIFVSPTLFSVATERYVFYGGAHGNTTAIFNLIDTGQRRNLEAGDIFIEGWEDALKDKIRDEALRRLSGPEGKGERSLASHGFFEEQITPSASIFICRTGVGFHYDRYRLAPYAAGDFMFVVPWNELEGLLKTPWPWGELP